MWSLRPFLNTDTPTLSEIWSEHHRVSGSSSNCPPSVWDQCILSKAFFRPDELLLAQSTQDTVDGFIHFGPALNEEESGFCADRAIIHRLCVRPSALESEVSQLLITQALRVLRERRFSECRAIGDPRMSVFYLGVAEGDNLLGLLANDTRMIRWLQDAGFQPKTPTECWELSLDTFRPTMDRLQIAIRRTCTISRILDEYHPSWWISTILGHCEQLRFNLSVRGPHPLDKEIMLWYPDSTIRGVDSNTVRLRLPAIPDDEESRERFVCLISEAMRQLQQERKRAVRVVSAAEQHQTIRLLQKLGFRSMSHGLVFSNDLLERGQR